MAAKRSGPVRVPLSPDVITDLGGIGAFPERSARRADGRWSAAYRIWTCYGHRSRGNTVVGTLRLLRRPAREGFELVVDQTVRNAGGVVERLAAQVLCSDDPLASPRQWSITIRFTDKAGKAKTALTRREEARLTDGKIEVTTAGKTFQRPASRHLTADWCLFEAVGRLPFGKSAPLKFDLLEGLSLLKRDHRLAYAGQVETRWAERQVRLHKFHHFGRGLLPYEYWLDDQHRLLLVVTGPRAYILDDALAAGGKRR